MATSIACTGCGKRFNVKDEILGRRVKCPQCQTSFVAAAAPAAEDEYDLAPATETPPPKTPPKSDPAPPRLVPAPPTTAASAMAFPPASRRPVASPKDQKVPLLHLSKGVIVLIAFAIGLPTVFFIWHVGPGRVRANWEQQQPQAESEIKDVMDRAIQSYESQHGQYNPRKAHQVPHALDVSFLLSPLYWTMPDKIGFAGTSTGGAFHGQYHTQSHEIEADMDVGGSAMPGVLVRRGDATVHVTGQSKSGQLSVEIDGKPAEILYPPVSNEE